MPIQSPHKVGWARFCAHETHAAEGNKKNRPTQLRARRFGVTYGGVLPFAGVGFVGLPDSRHSNVHRFGAMLGCKQPNVRGLCQVKGSQRICTDTIQDTNQFDDISATSSTADRVAASWPRNGGGGGA